MIKLSQLLKEIKIHQPRKEEDTIIQYIKDSISQWMKIEIEDYYEGLMLSLVQENEDIITFIKNNMIENNHELLRGGHPYLVTYDTKITEKELLEYIDDNREVISYINDIIFRYYFEQHNLKDYITSIKQSFYKDFDTWFEEDKQDTDIIRGDIEDLVFNTIEDNIDLYLDDLPYDQDFKNFLYKILH